MPDQFPPLGPPPPPEKKGLFGSKPAPAPSADISGMQDVVNNLSTRVRVSEERYADLRDKLQFLEQNMLGNHKKALGQIKEVTAELSEMQRAIREIENKLVLVIKELQLTAKKEDVDVIRKYADILKPLQFVTVHQAEAIARDAVEESKRAA
ncbi:hypothetical protein HY642_01520 [Candidatus Woesearchaeota archaeon]|nr:hypothetical protein [Candidatus Woesearchaeota archaeon]